LSGSSHPLSAIEYRRRRAGYSRRREPAARADSATLRAPADSARSDRRIFHAISLDANRRNNVSAPRYAVGEIVARPEDAPSSADLPENWIASFRQPRASGSPIAD